MTFLHEGKLTVNSLFNTLFLTQTLCVLNFSFYMHAFKIINVLYFVLFNSDMKETGLKELRRAMESSLMQMEMFSR